MDIIIGFGLGVAVGIFHVQVWALAVAGWAKFKAWRASRVA